MAIIRSTTADLTRQLSETKSNENVNDLALQEKWFYAAENNDLATLVQLRPDAIKLARREGRTFYDGYQLLHHAKIAAFKHNNISMLKFLMDMVKETGFNENIWLQCKITRTVVEEATSTSDDHVIFKEGEINYDGNGSNIVRSFSPFVYAIEEKKEELAEFLFNHCDCHINLYINQDVKYTTFFTDTYYHAPHIKGTPLTLAVENGSAYLVDFLLRNWANTEGKHSDTYYGLEGRAGGWVRTWKEADLTALLVAAKNKNNHDENEMLKIAKLLLEHGANVEAKTRDDKLAVDLTTSDAMKKLIFSYYPHAALLRYAKFEGDIPERFTCAFTKSVHKMSIIMENPVTYKGTTFCKDNFLATCKGKYDRHFTGVDGQRITKSEFDEILKLQPDQALKKEIRDFAYGKIQVNEAKMQIEKTDDLRNSM